MRSPRLAIAEKTRDLIAPVSDYSLYLCHDGAGTDLTDSAPAAQQLLGDFTVNGTLTNVWDTEGNFQPAGDHAVRLQSTAQQAAGDLTTLAAQGGQLIIFLDMYGTAAPTTAINCPICYGDNATETGFRINLLQTSGRAQLQHHDQNSVLISVPGNNDLFDSARHNICAVLDAGNAAAEIFIDGAQEGAQSLDANALCLSNSWGWAMLANIVSAGGHNNYLGSGGAAGLIINRIGIMRTSSDQSNNISSIASGLAQIAHEMPWAMDGI